MNAIRWSTAVLAAGLTMAGVLSAAPAGHAARISAHRQARPAGAADPRLARFYSQHVRWHRCQRGPHDAGGKILDAAGARCADIMVPLDYAHPGRRTITIAISRLAADPSAQKVGAMIINLGGPATPVLTDVVLARQAMGATGARFDLIGMDQRFAGRSTHMNCHWNRGWLPRGAGRSRASFTEMVHLTRNLAHRCARFQRAMLPFAGTANAARDMDVIRGALGESKLSYLGYSYGTYLGAMYTQMFPGRAGRIVLDSAINPAHPGVAKGSNGPQREAALHEWAKFAAMHDSQYHLGSTPSQVIATVYRIYRAAARHPLSVGPFRVDDTIVPAVLLDPLSDDSPANAAELAATVASLNRAAHGRPARPDAMLLHALARQLTSAGSAQRSAQTAIMCDDAPVPRSPRAYWRAIQAHRASAPLFSPVDQTITPCAFWPFQPPPPPRIANHVPALVVNASGDINSILSMGRAMHHALAGSRMITLQGVRTHGVYLFRGSACVDGAVNAYLNTGVLPAHDMSCTA
ncbi:MAG TPA: alpha/beta fold hydrolase [Streptosporangiaceae bacterium]|nr:alpha/beta fold hydrolase [Streptosporangiaceae bacterium]